MGVGSEGRMRSHWNAARKGKHGNSLVQDVCNEHLTHGISPECRVLVVCPSHEYAYALEIEAIAAYGRKNLGEGHLCNIAAGGAGPDAELMNNPEIVAKITAKSRTYWGNPENREKHKGIIQSAVSDPSYKKVVSEQTKKALNDPAVRARHLAGLKKANAAQTKEQRSAAQVRSYANDPERRIKVSVWAKQHNSIPSVKEAKSKASTAANILSWKDPSIRAKRIACLVGKKKTLTPASLEARRLNLAKALAARKSLKE